MVDLESDRGILDTSVVVELEHIAPVSLPGAISISAITLAELAAGPHATADPAERAIRQDRLQRIESVFDPLPFDAAAGRAFGRLYASEVGAGRKPRGPRAMDLLIAAIALAWELPLYTLNPGDFRCLKGLAPLHVPAKLSS